MDVSSRETSEARGNGVSAVGAKFANGYDAALHSLGTKRLWSSI
jgi:hypothetical protein